MYSWFKKELGDAVWAAPYLETLKEMFASIYGSSHAAGEAVVLVKYDSASHLHCEVTVYFSPAATTLATAVNAEPCVQPSFTDLSLLVGNKQTWDALLVTHQQVMD